MVVCSRGIDQEFLADFCTGGIEQLRFYAGAVGIAERATGIYPRYRKAAAGKPGNGGIVLVPVSGGVDDEFASDLAA